MEVSFAILNFTGKLLFHNVFSLLYSFGKGIWYIVVTVIKVKISPFLKLSPLFLKDERILSSKHTILYFLSGCVL